MCKNSLERVLGVIVGSVLAGVLVMFILAVLGLKSVYVNMQEVKEKSVQYQAESRISRMAEETKRWKVVFKDGTEHQLDGVFADVVALWHQVGEVPVYVNSVPSQQKTEE